MHLQMDYRVILVTGSKHNVFLHSWAVTSVRSFHLCTYKHYKKYFQVETFPNELPVLSWQTESWLMAAFAIEFLKCVCLFLGAICP